MSRTQSQLAHRRLVVWERAMDVACECYRLSVLLPPGERFGLAAQLRQAGTSVVANIAEGVGRRGKRDFAHYLAIARGSAMEVDAHSELAARLGLVPPEEVERVQGLTIEVVRMLSAMLRGLSPLK